MNTTAPPTPALVTERGAQRLPRLALILLCASYVLPGVIGRDPWRNADLTAYGYMLAMAEGRTPWWAPTLGGLPAETALLPHGLGALFIQMLAPLGLPAELAARVPFALLLVMALALTWYASYHLARTEAAQPVPFAFGGEASPVDYARALADGAVLALLASLGLLQLGHETTPELMQLSEVALLMWGLALMPERPRRGALAAATGILALAASGAPSLAVGMGLVATAICWGSAYAQVRRLSILLLLAVLAAGAFATLLSAWQWRMDWAETPADWWSVLRQMLWFTWPTWPFALWTLWRWRGHWLRRHLSIPLGLGLCALLTSLSMGGNDRALMLALPCLAVMAAFALPTFQRSTAAAIDWFSVFFFSLSALVIWVIAASMHLGVPAKPLANIQRLAPGFEPVLSWPALVAAGLGTLAWLGLVRWRTARNRHPVWKSLVLPASGVTLAWLLTMTLLLPALDYARSLRPWVAQVQRLAPAGACLRTSGLGRPQIAALETQGGYRVQADNALNADAQRCNEWRLVNVRNRQANSVPDGWQLQGQVRRPTERNETTLVLRRRPADAQP